MGTKYNTGVPININELTDEERKLAFHEWAEGSEALELLLNEGYNKGFISHACCGGDKGNPYIYYELNDDISRKMAMCIAQRLVQSDLDCAVTIYDNFLLNEANPENFPTRDIISLNVQTKMENREQVFNEMSQTIRVAELDKIILPKTEAEIPCKHFEKTKENCNDKNEFIAKLKNQTYAEEYIFSKDLKQQADFNKENIIEKKNEKYI